MIIPPLLQMDIELSIQAVQTAFGITFFDEDFRGEDREEILHVLIHEACHAATSKASPWIHKLPDDQHTLVDEIIARLLEGPITAQLKLHAHSAEQQAKELALYGFTISEELFHGFAEAWNLLPPTLEGIDQMARRVHSTLFGNESYDSA